MEVYAAEQSAMEEEGIVEASEYLRVRTQTEARVKYEQRETSNEKSPSSDTKSSTSSSQRRSKREDRVRRVRNVRNRNRKTEKGKENINIFPFSVLAPTRTSKSKKGTQRIRK